MADGTHVNQYISWSLRACISPLELQQIPQTRWLKTTNVDSLSSGGQKAVIYVSAGLVPSRGSEGEPVSCLSPELLVGVCSPCSQAYVTSRQSPLLSSHSMFPVCICVHSGLGQAYSNPVWPHLKLQRPYFQARSYSQSGHEFGVGEHYSTQYRAH